MEVLEGCLGKVPLNDLSLIVQVTLKVFGLRVSWCFVCLKSFSDLF